MSGWFRSWHGAPTHHKWLVVAKRADTIPAVVSAIVWALLDHASKRHSASRGDVTTFDVESYSTYSGVPEEAVRAVLGALEDRGFIKNGHIPSWEKHQPKREDSSTERTRKYRERSVTQCDATERAVTVDKIRSDKNSALSDLDSAGFEDWYKIYPRHEAKGRAEKAYRSALTRVDAASLQEATRRAVERFRGTDPKFIPLPASWLNADRWLDEPPKANGGRGGIEGIV